MATVAAAADADPLQVMEVVTKDTSLNISAAYLRPGFAFGGSCLPKDLRALLTLGRGINEMLPMLTGIVESNRRRIEQAIELITSRPAKHLALIGLSFKQGTDDLRESPYVEIAERLLGKGYDLRICDPDIDLSRVVGSNKAWVELHLPRLARLLCAELRDALEGADGVVLCKSVMPHDVLAERLPPTAPAFDLECIASRSGSIPQKPLTLVRDRR